uniref:LON peptidase N-terminal domain and ring finger 4 n=1 Tax=Latimeria chalumnae TaxID=7897 RepID=H3BGV7_LATCH
MFFGAMEWLLCPGCQCPLADPVTVSCGHSFCKRCLGKSLPRRCPTCGERLKLMDTEGPRVSILLCGVLEKCFARETKLAKLRSSLQDQLREQKFKEALKFATKGVDRYPEDVALRLYRSEAQIALQNFSEALSDLEVVCTNKPEWPEGYFRKGKVFLDLGEKTEALIQFHHCLKLDSEFTPAKREIGKILVHFSPVPEPVEELLEAVSQYLKHSCSGLELQAVPFKSTQETEGEEKPDTQKNKTRKKRNRNSQCKFFSCLSYIFFPSVFPFCPLYVNDESQKNQLHSLAQELLSISDFECSLCISQLFSGRQSACWLNVGKCLERSYGFRHSHSGLAAKQYLKNRKHNCTVLIQEILSVAFPSELAERKRAHAAEMSELSNLMKDIPIFVCTMAFPGIHCPLHVFEPRYRLMMRRCLETGTKKFGMCIYEPGKNFSDYGCTLEILGTDILPDGRSLVDTVGGRRFRVLSRGQRDGYNTADVEYLEDEKVEGEELVELQRFHDNVYQKLQGWCCNPRTSFPSHISWHHGPVPDAEDIQVLQASPDGPAWCWWLLAVLPLDTTYQMTVFSMTSLKDRLSHLRRVLELFSQN